MRALVLFLLAGCGEIVYPCDVDAECRNHGAQGKCVNAGAGESYCAFPDSLCPSGLRWDPSAPSSLAKDCVGKI